MFAFLFRRRRDDDLRFAFESGVPGADGHRAAPNAVPAVPASRSMASAIGAVGDAPVDVESDIPRWRRPSVQAARRSRFAPPSTDDPVRFDTAPVAGVERLIAAYRLVRVGDGPDDVHSQEVGRLERGDEVDVLEQLGEWSRIRRADDLRGWVPSFTLARHPGSADADAPEPGEA